MNNHIFESNARKSRFKAICLAISFHIIIIGGMLYTSPGSIDDVQQFFKEAFETAEKDKPYS